MIAKVNEINEFPYGRLHNWANSCDICVVNITVAPYYIHLCAICIVSITVAPVMILNSMLYKCWLCLKSAFHTFRYEDFFVPEKKVSKRKQKRADRSDDWEMEVENVHYAKDSKMKAENVDNADDSEMEDKDDADFEMDDDNDKQVFEMFCYL